MQNLLIRNFSTNFPTIGFELYTLDPSTISGSPVQPTYAFTPTTTNTSLPWPRSPINADCETFYVATNDGSGPQNVEAHTGDGATNIQVKLEDDGSGGLKWVFTD